jgi:ribosome-associated protein
VTETAALDRLAKARLVVDAALERKALDVVALDVRELTSYADTFVIASGTSDRHARSLADAILEAAAARGLSPLGVEGYDEGRWVLIDLGDVIVHLFHADVRQHYDLERLWSDAPVLPLDAEARTLRR